MEQFASRIAARRRDRLYALLLAIIAAAGAWLRAGHADWDGGNLLHPDERGILFVAQQVELPSTPADLFSPRSTLNPLRDADHRLTTYAYGHLPLYTSVFAQRTLEALCGLPDEPCAGISPSTALGRLLNTGHAPRIEHLLYTGRALSALFDTLTILVAACLARRLYGRLAGLLAAGFVAFAVTHIQNAHFGTVDAPLAAFCTLTVWLCVRYHQQGRPADSLLAGLCAGLATGCKVTGSLLAFPLLIAHLRPTAPQARPAGWRIAEPRRYMLAVLAAGAAFALTNPYALLDPVAFGHSIAAQAQMASGWADWPFIRQYAGTLPVWYHLLQQARWGLGLPLTLAACAGLAWAVIPLLRRRGDSSEMILAAWVIPALLAVGVQQAKFMRYLLPMIPALLALAAGMLATATLPRRVRPTLIAAVALPELVYALAFFEMYSQPHPWAAGSEWIYRHLPPGTVIAAERWDDPLPLDIPVDGVGHIRAETFDSRLLDPFAEPDNRAKLRALLADLAASDYLVISSNRLYGVIPRLADRYPLTAATYRALFAGQLGFTLEQQFSRYPQLGPVSLVDDTFTRPGLPIPPGFEPAAGLSPGFADESFTVYDHPLVLVFRNQARLSVDDLEQVVLSWLGRP